MAEEIRSTVFDGVSDEVLELVLARLPVKSLLTAGQVCKDWSSVIRSDQFAKFFDKASSRKSWFFQCCVNFVVPEKNQGYGYDPETQQWHRISAECFPKDRQIAFAGSREGCFYSISGLTDLSYKREFLSNLWEEAPAMHYSRNGTLLGAVGGAEGADKLIVAGGVTFFEEDDLAVEIYDTAVGSWELCQSVPLEFRGNCSRHWMTSAVAGERFYIAEKYSGASAFFDLDTRVWSAVRTVRPPGVVHSHLLALESQLLLAGSCYVGDKQSFKIWEVNNESMECGLVVASMPEELLMGFSRGEDGLENKGEGLECMASGNLVYVFVQVNSREQTRDNRVVVCDLSSRSPSWTLLPPLPASASYNHIVGFTSPVKLEFLVSK